MWSHTRCRRAMGCSCPVRSVRERGGWCSVETAGRVLSKSGSLGVALVDTEVVRLACGRVGKYCLAILFGR
jgi:hypothetical protein